MRCLTCLGCERETLEIVTVSNLSGHNWFVNLSDPSFSSPMDFLSQDLLVTDGVRRRRTLADVRHAQRLDSQDERSPSSPSEPITPVDKSVDTLIGVKVKDLLSTLSDRSPVPPRGAIAGDLMTADVFGSVPDVWGLAAWAHVTCQPALSCWHPGHLEEF